ncbi:hypothetical protein AHAS_Ahas07G0163200 [Arachis hypogaea]
MAGKLATMKTLRSARKNTATRNIQLREAGDLGDLSSPSKSDSGTSTSLKVTPDPTPPSSNPLVDPCSQSISLALPVPESRPKKRKTLESESVYDHGFDTVAFCEKRIFFL